jgi:dihydroneopterin aldolase
LGKISVKGLKVFAYHGVNPGEKEYGQVFILDIDAQTDLKTAGLTDKIEDTVSYAKIIKTASAIMVSEKNNLLERAAHRVAEGLLDEFPALEAVKINLKKPDAPIIADFKYVAVEIEMIRSPI